MATENILPADLDGGNVTGNVVVDGGSPGSPEVFDGGSP